MQAVVEDEGIYMASGRLLLCSSNKDILALNCKTRGCAVQ